ncbi:MAG TPA: cell division protein SepF [Fimbriimonadaceae bacterium]|nr:cell division protein SepF [Fimbriimonadaceae bacterium]
MDELAGKPGFFERVVGFFHRHEDEEFDDHTHTIPTSHVRIGVDHTHHFTVRRQVVSFQDAVAAADGLKRNESQIINLTLASPDLREKIKDFMCGVNYTAEGSWEELGEHVYLLAPANAYVEVAPCSQASTPHRFDSSI